MSLKQFLSESKSTDLALELVRELEKRKVSHADFLKDLIMHLAAKQALDMHLEHGDDLKDMLKHNLSALTDSASQNGWSMAGDVKQDLGNLTSSSFDAVVRKVAKQLVK